MYKCQHKISKNYRYYCNKHKPKLDEECKELK